MIGEPPSDAGAVQDTVASPSPATAVTLVGAPGTVAGVTELLAEDAALVPALLVAVTVKVYAVPFVRPVTSHVRVEPSAVVQDLVLSSTAVAV